MERYNTSCREVKTDRFRYNIGWGERWKQNGLGIILVGKDGNRMV